MSSGAVIVLALLTSVIIAVSVWAAWRYVLHRLLFGDDVFISYSRNDGSDYAAALGEALTRLNLSCRLDQWDTEPGLEMPPRLVRAVRDSSLLVVIGSIGAAASPPVKREIEESVRRADIWLSST